MFSSGKIIVPRTAQYYKYGNEGPETRYNWMLFHGYGQLANRIIRKWNVFNPNEHFVLAPEGLSKFYWEGVNRVPAASWMTKHFRYDEIADQITYINELDGNYSFSKRKNRVKIALGFSQGGATLWRWMLYSHPDIDHAIFWGTNLPDDMLFEPHLEYLSGLQIHYVIGKQDQFLTKERMDQLRSQIDSAGLKVHWYFFDGNHSIPRKVLAEWFENNVNEK